MKRYAAWQAKKLVDVLRDPAEISSELEKGRARMSALQDSLIQSTNLLCKSGHRVIYTTSYPSTYSQRFDRVLCDFCDKELPCKDGYFRCSDDGSTCKEDWCKECEGK
jgi:hypothetical protein